MHMNTLTIQMNPVNKSFDLSCFVFGFCFLFLFDSCFLLALHIDFVHLCYCFCSFLLLFFSFWLLFFVRFCMIT